MRRWNETGEHQGTYNNVTIKILRLNGCTREPQTEWQEPMILLNNIGLLTITHTRSIEYVDNAMADAASNNQPAVTEYMSSVYTHK